MKVVIRKWGNSLGLRIPKLLADQMEITENSVVEIDIVKGYIEIKLIKREPTLEELVESVNEGNIHTKILHDAKGKESW